MGSEMLCTAVQIPFRMKNSLAVLKFVMPIQEHSKSRQVKIQAGRHPLQELCTPTFIPNDTTLGERSRMAVLTGPNACGKSVYLKQVGMIALLAHLGSWVPAEVAVIPVMDRASTYCLVIPEKPIIVGFFYIYGLSAS